MQKYSEKAALEEISTFISNNMTRRTNNIQPNTPLLHEGLIDSAGIVELIFFVEQKFNVTLSHSDLTHENLETIEKIASMITNKKEAENADS